MKVKVLLVDDEKQFVETLAMRLEVRDYAVATAFNGEQALAYLRDQDVDVVVLDVQMSGLSGMDTLREMKKIRPLTEVILLTGHATVETAVEGMRLGGFDYLLKPTEIDQLVDKITRAHRRKLRRLEEEVALKTIALERSQQKLAKSEKLCKSLVESAEDAFLNVDARGEIISINRYGAKVLGYTQQGIVGKTKGEAFPGDTGKEIARQVDEVFADRQGHRTILTKKVKIQQDLSEGLPRARVDADQLQQIFLNLVTNAVLAMPQGGLLAIGTRLNADKDRVQIRFADTGVGIKKENLAKIYAPFFTTREVGEGTGLGLSVSYAIVHKFGGAITARVRPGERPGMGQAAPLLLFPSP